MNNHHNRNSSSPPSSGASTPTSAGGKNTGSMTSSSGSHSYTSNPSHHPHVSNSTTLGHPQMLSGGTSMGLVHPHSLSTGSGAPTTSQSVSSPPHMGSMGNLGSHGVATSGMKHHRDDNQLERDTKRRKLSRGPHGTYSPPGLPPMTSSGPTTTHPPPPHGYSMSIPQPQGSSQQYGSIYNNNPPYNSSRFAPLPPNHQSSHPTLHAQHPPHSSHSQQHAIYDYQSQGGVISRQPSSHSSIPPPRQQQPRHPMGSYPPAPPIPQQPIRPNYSRSSSSNPSPIAPEYNYTQGHQQMDHGRHSTTPMSPVDGGKRKPSIFHTPAHKPPQNRAQGESSHTPKSPGDPVKKVPLQARRDVQLFKILTNTDSEKKRPTKEELLTMIEAYDVEIAKLEKELSVTKQSKITDSVVVDDEKCLQDTEVKRKPHMHQLIFSNLVKSVESHTQFDSLNYVSTDGDETPLLNQNLWDSLYAKHVEDYKKIKPQLFRSIKMRVDRDKRWIRNVRKTFSREQKKWLKVKKTKIKPPPKDWLAVSATPPPMLTEQEKELIFLSDNLFIEDPAFEDADYYNKAAELSRWSDYEVEIFRQKYHLFPKNFRKISEFLPSKSVGDCICFYYHNKKDPILKQVMEEVKAKGSFQVAYSEGAIDAGKQRHAEASEGAEKQGSDEEGENSDDDQYKPRGRPKRKKGSSEEWTDTERSQFVEAYELYPKDFKRIANAVQTKTVAQCKTFFAQFKDDLGLEKPRGGRRGRRSRTPAASVAITAPKPEEPKKTTPTPAASSAKGRSTGKRKGANKRQTNHWTKAEKIEFLQCLRKYGKDWKSIAENFEGRTESQVMKYYQSIKKSLGLSTKDKDEADETRKDKKKERSKDETLPNEVTVPPDNDLKFFAEIAAIKESIDLNSECFIDDIQEDRTYSNTTLVHAWIAKKYLSGVNPTDERPLALSVLARESAKKYKYSLSIPDDIKPFITEDNSQITNYTELHRNDGLGSFWGDNILDEGETDDDNWGASAPPSPII